LGGLTLLPFARWPWPSGEAALLVVASGVFVAGGFYCMVQAMRLGEISAVAPFRYGTMLWALLIGIVLWGEVPNLVAVAGFLIVVVAGLAMFGHERRVMQARLASLRAPS
jgi:drug/metabolite transporter (DMT)-like permease